MVAIPSPYPHVIDITFNGSTRIQKGCLRIMTDHSESPSIIVDERLPRDDSEDEQKIWDEIERIAPSDEALRAYAKSMRKPPQ